MGNVPHRGLSIYQSKCVSLELNTLNLDVRTRQCIISYSKLELILENNTKPTLTSAVDLTSARKDRLLKYLG